jgi:hypothetical protein
MQNFKWPRMAARASGEKSNDRRVISTNPPPPKVSHFKSFAVPILHSFDATVGSSDKSSVNFNMQPFEPAPAMTSPWAMQMRAVSNEEPAQVIQTLTGAILGCGGWVLSRGANDSGIVSILFEFERQLCVDIYTMLIAAGLELSQAGHISLTDLCQCTCNNLLACGTEIASIDLEIRTFPPEAHAGSRQPRPA